MVSITLNPTSVQASILNYGVPGRLVALLLYKYKNLYFILNIVLTINCPRVKLKSRNARSEKLHSSSYEISCRSCDACSKDECGQCTNCEDMIKFGDCGRKRQCCVQRQCMIMCWINSLNYKCVAVLKYFLQCNKIIKGITCH